MSNNYLDKNGLSYLWGKIKAYATKATGDALATKVDKVTGKGLSENDYTTAEKTKLAGIENGATNVTIDSTLTQEGEAADAKAVGDEIAGVKRDLDDLGLSVVNGKLCITYKEVTV